MKDLNMQTVGDHVFFSLGNHPVGTTRPLAEGDFSATVTSLTSTTITSVATGMVNQTIDGYSLQCVEDPFVVNPVPSGAINISIPGKLLLQTTTS